MSGAVFTAFVEPYLYDFEPPTPKRGMRLRGWDAGYLHLHAAMEWSMPSQEGEQVGGEQLAAITAGNALTGWE